MRRDVVGRTSARTLTLHPRAAQPGWRALLRACRPRQWAKNVLVVAAPGAAGVLGHATVAPEVIGAFVSFCLLSSSTYLINDVRDREQDRLHPRKRWRPVAAGDVSVRTAVQTAVALAAAGIVAAALVRPALALMALGYLGLTGSYSLWLRRVIVADMLIVAAGFVLRAAAGGVAVDVPLSRWFLVVTSACALFLVAGKRYAELRDRDVRSVARATLRRYSAGPLRLLLVGCAAVACTAYAMWAFQRPEHGPWYELSSIPFALALARYGSLLGAGAGEAPEELILRDRALIALGVAWTILFLGGVYGGG